MRVLSRDFTRAEAAILAIFGFLLVALVYYRFVHMVVVRDTAKAIQERDALQNELTITQGRLSQYRKMNNEIQQNALSSLMPSYNSYQAEITLMNGILLSASQYTLNFSNPVRSGDQVRREFTLTYTAPDYASAKSILRQLEDSEIRCLPTKETMNGAVKGDSPVTVTLTGVFFETMVDGKTDIFLIDARSEADRTVIEDEELTE